MSETVVLLPWWPLSATVFASLPFYRSALDVFEKQLDVSVADLPWVRGEGPRRATPRSIDELSKSFASYTVADAHVLAMGGTGIFFILGTAQEPPKVKSLVFDSFPVPPATLGALGMSGLADIAAVALRVEPGTLRDFMPMAIPGGGPDAHAELAARIKPTIEWEHLSEAFRLALDVDLTELNTALPARTLFLDNPVSFPGLLDKKMARRLFPGVEVQTREASDVMDRDKGARFAEQVLDFVSGRSR